jgi:hypothetical protein
MKTWIRYVLAGALMLSAAALRAEDAAAPKTDTAKPAVEKPHGGKAEREKLTPEQRKEAREKAQAKLKELQAKKDAGTLSEAEKKQLARLEKRGKGPGARKPKHSEEQPK